MKNDNCRVQRERRRFLKL